LETTRWLSGGIKIYMNKPLRSEHLTPRLPYPNDLQNIKIKLRIGLRGQNDAQGYYQNSRLYPDPHQF